MDTGEKPALPFAVGASAIGPLHVQKGLPCQDAFRIAIGPSGWLAIAVADGLGSAARSDIGAKLAVEKAATRALDLLERFDHAEGSDEVAEPATGVAKSAFEGDIPEVELVSAVSESIHAARDAMEKLAESEGCRLKDLACTLLVAIAGHGRLATAHLGDGAIVALTQEGLMLVSSPGDSEYANEVTPLTSDDWEQSVCLSPVSAGVKALGVFTDGLQRAALRKSPAGYSPFAGFWNPLFQYASAVASTNEADSDIERLLMSSKMAENSEDDKTLVIAVLER